MICDNKTQGACHDYYVLSSDFNLNNIARYDEISNYVENFQLDKFHLFQGYSLNMFLALFG